MRNFLLGLITGILITGVAWAATTTIHGRGLDSNGNWQSIHVDSNGQLKIA